MSSKAWGLIVVGYSTAAASLVAFFTINGASGIPGAATIGTAFALAMGLMLPAAGMLLLRRGVDSSQRTARLGFAAQAFGLLGLLLGLVLVVAVPTLTAYFVGAVFIVTSGVLAIAGAVLLRGRYAGAASSKAGDVAALGTALIFCGAAMVFGSDIAFEYLISQVQNTVNVDLGATLSACGCILAAYSFYSLSRSRLSQNLG